jgi:hypothetical protein
LTGFPRTSEIPKSCFPNQAAATAAAATAPPRVHSGYIDVTELARDWFSQTARGGQQAKYTAIYCFRDFKKVLSDSDDSFQNESVTKSCRTFRDRKEQERILFLRGEIESARTLSLKSEYLYLSH